MDKKIAIATVGNFKYLRKNINNFLKELRNNGKYRGEVIIITSYFTPTFLFRSLLFDKSIQIYRFKKIKFDRQTDTSLSGLETGKEPNRHLTKNFQWHKLNLFDKKLNEWDYIFYLDINMRIHYDLNLILKDKPKNSLLARSDSYPDFERELSSQFDQNHSLYKKLNSQYNLSRADYFQTGVMYFDTSIIKQNTKEEILKLVKDFPISITNEQGILNIYFLYHKKLFKELKTEVDDFITYYYWLVKNKKIIITKQNRVKYK